MISFFDHIKNVIRYMQLPKKQKQITFYSEGKNYWPHLEGLVNEILKTTNIKICYVSSSSDDPGLQINHSNYEKFEIGEGHVRNWFFQNLETNIMVMTMPDLNTFQIKRSKNNVHYVYIQHSLVSLHMVYRKGAFDHFDTIFCAGPHHIKELRKIEKKYNLQAKNLFEHGYHRLDSLISNAKNQTKKKTATTPLHVLIAPSWGEHGIIESGLAINIVGLLIKKKLKVTLRPHPQTLKFAKLRIDSILKKYKNNSMFNYELFVSKQDSLHSSDIMISDWSGVAIEYAFGLRKPVFFIDTKRKVNNPDYLELEIEPLELTIREQIGKVVDIRRINEDLDIDLIDINLDIDLIKDNVFNLRKSAKFGAKELERLLNEK